MQEVSSHADDAYWMIACVADDLEAELFVGMASIYAGPNVGAERHHVLAVRLPGWHHPPQ